MEKLEEPSNQQQQQQQQQASSDQPDQQDRIDHKWQATDGDDDGKGAIAAAAAERPPKTPIEDQERPSAEAPLTPPPLPPTSPVDGPTNNHVTDRNNANFIQANAVRVLFKNQQDKEQALPQQQQQLILSNHPEIPANGGNSQRGVQAQPVTPPAAPAVSRGSVGQLSRRLQAPIVSANRRLIERQIEAMQEADSRRWNFDFRACRPLDLADHRYFHLSDSRNSMNNDNNNNITDTITNNNNSNNNCRPLGDQNAIIASRLLNQHRWSSRATRGNQRDRSDHNKPEE